MKPAPFAYAKARSLDHAVEALGAYDGAAARRRAEPDRHAQYAARHPACWSTSTASGGSTASRKGEYVEIGALVAPRSASIRPWSRSMRRCSRCDAAYRASGDPQPRHLRRLHRVCGSGGRVAGLPAGARRRDRDRRTGGRRKVTADDFFKGLFETALRRAGNAHRHPYSCWRQVDTLRLRRAGAPPRRLRDGRSGGCARANGTGPADVRLAYFGVGKTPVRARKPKRRLPPAMSTRRWPRSRP